MNGTCGTCGRPAAATSENEGYSDCCNDRIEYGRAPLTKCQRCAGTGMNRVEAEGRARFEGICPRCDGAGWEQA